VSSPIRAERAVFGLAGSAWLQAKCASV